MDNLFTDILANENDVISEPLKIIQELKEFLKQKFSSIDQIYSIILFGSFARLEASNESDIDLCIIFKEGADKSLEEWMFDQFLDLGKKVNKSIQCVFIYLDDLNHWDPNFIENIIAEGKIVYGLEDVRNFLISKIELEPYQVIILNLNDISNSDKMKLKRILYGYTSLKRQGNKEYKYKKQGIVQKNNGDKLGRGAFLIPEDYFPLIKQELNQFHVKYRNFRIWIQKI